MSKILISLTVIHTRLAKLHLTIESLLAQNYEDLEVRVHASREAFLLDQGAQEVPTEVQRLMAQDSRLQWRWVPNIGSYRKLLPVLNELVDEDQLIVTADDDTIYPATWLGTLAQYHSLFDCIVCFRGHFIVINNGTFAPYRSWMKHGVIENPSELLLPTGKDGVLYRTTYFDRRVLDYVRALELAPTADDLWFKWHTAVNNIPVYCIEPDYTKGSLVDTGEGPSLYLNFNNLGANDQAISRLHTYAQAEWGFDLAAVPTRHAMPLSTTTTSPAAQPPARASVVPPPPPVPAEPGGTLATSSFDLPADRQIAVQSAVESHVVPSPAKLATSAKVVREVKRLFRRKTRAHVSPVPSVNDAKKSKPEMFHIDCPAPPFAGSGSTEVSGWAIGASGREIKRIRAVTMSGIFPGEYGLERPDVMAAFPAGVGSLNTGFSVNLRLPLGVHQISVEISYAEDEWKKLASFEYDAREA